MTTQAIVIVDEIIGADEEEMRLDRLPGMPLLGFFTGATISLALWGLLGWAAWSLLA